MKYVVIALLFLSGCKTQQQKTETVTPTDTVYIYTPKDTVYLNADCPSLDSLQSALDIANFKLQRVKFYIDIVKRKPSQKVFLLGWVDRATR